MKRTLITLLACCFTFGVLAGCNTIEGAGKDVEKAGEKVQGAAKDAKK
jgi:predicted small secreted protein